MLSLSKKFQIPVGKIISLNNLNREIEEGDMLYLEKDCAQTIYVVEVKDTLNSISQKFGISSQEILEKNQLPYIFYGLTIFL